VKNLILSALLFLMCSCGVLRDTPADGGLRQQLIEMAAAVTDAAMRLEGTKLLQEHAPALVPLMDQEPKDGMVSVDEFVNFVANADAATIVVLGAIYFR
jgi:hypothetical protein